MQISVDSDGDGLVTLPVDNYENIAEVFFTVAGQEDVILDNLKVIGCIGQGVCSYSIIVVAILVAFEDKMLGDPWRWATRISR